MCELIKSIKTTKIKRERTVFKVFYYHSFSGNLFSPLRMKPYCLHEQVESEMTCHKGYLPKTFRTEKGLYSFKTKKAAEEFKKGFENTLLCLIFVIVKCKIPVGSQIIDCDDTEHRYYSKNYYSDVIISNKLIPIEVVN